MKFLPSCPVSTLAIHLPCRDISTIRSTSHELFLMDEFRDDTGRVPYSARIVIRTPLAIPKLKAGKPTPRPKVENRFDRV